MKAGYRAPISLNAEYLADKAKDAAVLNGFREAHLRDMKMLKGGWGGRKRLINPTGVWMFLVEFFEQLGVSRAAIHLAFFHPFAWLPNEHFAKHGGHRLASTRHIFPDFIFEEVPRIHGSPD
ncbi:MAG: hypothetical protein U1F81_23440 [Verrucomicrobiaceae bacterium]